jgi:hypothetical protein
MMLFGNQANNLQKLPEKFSGGEPRNSSQTSMDEFLPEHLVEP